MFYPPFVPPPAADQAEPPRRPRRRRRTGATALEYLFMLSLIIVVLVGVVQYIGSLVNRNFDNTNNAYPTTAETPPSSP